MKKTRNIHIKDRYAEIWKTDKDNMPHNISYLNHFEKSAQFARDVMALLEQKDKELRDMKRHIPNKKPDSEAQRLRDLMLQDASVQKSYRFDY